MPQKLNEAFSKRLNGFSRPLVLLLQYVQLEIKQKYGKDTHFLKSLVMACEAFSDFRITSRYVGADNVRMSQGGRRVTNFPKYHLQ